MNNFHFEAAKRTLKALVIMGLLGALVFFIIYNMTLTIFLYIVLAISFSFIVLSLYSEYLKDVRKEAEQNEKVNS